MGVVYKAEDTELGRFVALKFLPEDVARDPQSLERFRREARAASALNHPNICTIYEISQQDGHPFIAMEFLEGMTLKHRISGRPLDMEAAARSGNRDCRRAGRGAREGNRSSRHQTREFIHHRPRPRENSGFWLGEANSGDVRCHAHDEPLGSTVDTPSVQEADLTSAGTAVGTVAYMSPEQARGETLDVRSDLFSFGAVLYEMATGAVPFRGATTAVIFNAILEKAPAPAVRLNPDIPPRLEEVISKALEKDRRMRYQHAAELRTDLARLKRDTGSSRISGVVASAQATMPQQNSGAFGETATQAAPSSGHAIAAMTPSGGTSAAPRYHSATGGGVGDISHGNSRRAIFRFRRSSRPRRTSNVAPRSRWPLIAAAAAIVVVLAAGALFLHASRAETHRPRFHRPCRFHEYHGRCGVRRRAAPRPRRAARAVSVPAHSLRSPDAADDAIHGPACHRARNE